MKKASGRIFRLSKTIFRFHFPFFALVKQYLAENYKRKVKKGFTFSKMEKGGLGKAIFSQEWEILGQKMFGEGQRREFLR